MWVIYAVLSALFASLTALFAKIGVKDVDSDLATSIRVVVILVLTWSIVLFKGAYTNITSISKYSILFLVLSGLSTGISWLFYFKAIQIGNISKVAPIDKLSVVITMILAFVFLKEPVTVKDVIGGAMIAAGAIVLIY